MKNVRPLSLLLALLLLAGCGGEGNRPDAPAPEDTDPVSDGSALAGSPEPDPEDEITCIEPPSSQLCRIVDGAEDGSLLLAGLPGWIYEGEVFHLTVTDEMEIWMDHEQVTAAELEDGMVIDVVFRGEVQESFPAQFGDVLYLDAYPRGSEQNPGGTFYDLCGFYLQVLDDLWQVDPALNENISVVGLDLSDAPGGLLDSEKAALAYCFGQAHGVEVVEGTFDELAEQGYFTAETISTEVMEGDTPSEKILYHWEDGCLFTIRPHKTEELEIYSLPVLRFDADKWRGPLAAYCFYDCSAVWAEFGTWSGYQVGSQMIS